MAAGDPKVTIDEAAIQAMIRSWDSPIGRAIDDATQVVEDTARISAPVSPKGSKLAPIGFLKANTRQSLEHHEDADGVIMGLVGAASYPYNFIANPTSHKGYTWNRGHKTFRPGDNNYLNDALNSLEGFVRYVGFLWMT